MFETSKTSLIICISLVLYTTMFMKTWHTMNQTMKQEICEISCLGEDVQVVVRNKELFTLSRSVFLNG